MTGFSSFHKFTIQYTENLVPPGKVFDPFAKSPRQDEGNRSHPKDAIIFERRIISISMSLCTMACDCQRFKVQATVEMAFNLSQNDILSVSTHFCGTDTRQCRKEGEIIRRSANQSQAPRDGLDRRQDGHFGNLFLEILLGSVGIHLSSRTRLQVPYVLDPRWVMIELLHSLIKSL